MKMMKTFNALLLSCLALAAAPAFSSDSSRDDQRGGGKSESQDDIVSLLSWKQGEPEDDLKDQSKFDGSKPVLAEEAQDDKNSKRTFNSGANPGGTVWTSYNIPLASGAWHHSSLRDESDSDTEFESSSEHSSEPKSRDFRHEWETACKDQPKLTAVPLPPAFALFAVGLMPWFGSFKRRLSA